MTSLAAWHDLFLAGAGAASALAGLIIVAMSVNITTILTIPSMTSRAATTIAMLVLILVVACAGLVPDQSARAFGVETLVGSAIALILAVRSAGEILHAQPKDTARPLAVGKAALGVVPVAGALTGGAVLCGAATTGLHILAAAVITGFAAATANAWVLLVEIRR